MKDDSNLPDYKKLSDEFYSSQVTKEILCNYEEEEGAIKVLYLFAKWLNEKRPHLFRDVKKDTRNHLVEDAYFPPPWNVVDNPEKTEGWIAFQKAMREDPKYYKIS